VRLNEKQGIFAPYGANVYDTSVAQQMNQVDNAYRDKVNAYKAKMEMLRQEKLAEQKAKEAEATRQRERVEDRKYQTDQLNAQLKFETDKLKLQYIMNNEELDAKQRIAAANRLSELTGKQDNINTLTLGKKKITIDKDTYTKGIERLASNTIGKFFEGAEVIDLGLFKEYDPNNPTKAIEILESLIEAADSGKTENISPYLLYGENTGKSKIKFKKGVDKDDVIKYFDDLLIKLAYGEIDDIDVENPKKENTSIVGVNLLTYGQKK
jgi:multidrug efflux pump subunit AcrA (membrane-fusion protein)